MKIKKYVDTSLLLAIGSSHDLIWRDLNAKLKKENCNLLQALVLISLFFERSGPVTPSLLSGILGASRANMSHCISHLEKLGLIKRELDERDARSYRLVIRPEGRKTAARLIQVIDGLERFFEKRFGRQAVLEIVRGLTEMSGVYRETVEALD